ncbi:protein cramped-like [Ostrinia nubilalis]|uniref:protein cramped-like n=1 Tax=Ostrinia nubilalis TaxID=29057 RepID=UPI0030823020
MVRCGSIAVRARGRNTRVRTPACRALRNLNQITERVYCARVCGRAGVVLRARTSAAWARVQAAAHNPRAHAALPLRTRLCAFIRALEDRWTPPSYYKPESTVTEKFLDDQCKEADEESARLPACEDKDDEREDLEEQPILETDRMIVMEQKLPKRPVLHVGPRPGAEVHLPVVSPSEQLSSQKICFSSYLERMCSQRRDKDGVCECSVLSLSSARVTSPGSTHQ